MRDRLRRLVAAVIALAALGGVGDARGQGPAADWRTFTTAHFRVYFPAPAEPWARETAARLEGIRGRLAEVVGYRPPEIVDVVVADPQAEPNGIALPLLRRPRLVLWTSPPDPTTLLGRYTGWGLLVAVHETAHLVHLLRPSRSPWRRFLERTLLDVGPIPQKAPRWVVEGYATMLEGELTGSGRPASSLREAILRSWAVAGRLPDYRGLSSDSESWLGMSMAYLEGSAFLQWLVDRAGPDSLPHLWRRLTARVDRSFDEAFTGVFGEAPAVLYDRFRAERTAAAVAAARALAPRRRDGEAWEDLTWGTGPPAVSPDGAAVAVVKRGRDETPELLVLSAAPAGRAEKARLERQRAELRRDPGDVAAVPHGPPPHAVLYRLSSCGVPGPHDPRWLDGGRALLFTRFEPDREGFLHPDLFLWRPAGGRVRRVTTLADVREASPAPDGRWAVAVRRRWGASQLVRVDLADGAVSALTASSVDRVVASPALSPDGGTLAYVAHHRGRWELVLREMDGGRERVLPTGGAPLAAQPAWSADGAIVYAVVGDGDSVDVFAFPAAGGAARRVTRTEGAALAPAPSPDGRFLYFLSLSPDGLAIRRVGLAGAAVDGGALPAEEGSPAAPELGLLEPGAARKVGLGRQELDPVAGGSWATSARVLELGVRSGDVLGRLDVLGLGALGDGGVTGGAAAAVLRSEPVELTARLFATRERPSEQPGRFAGPGRALDTDRRGVLLGVGRRRRLGAAEVEAAFVAWASRLTPPGGTAFDRRAVSGRLGWASSQACRRWRFEQGAFVLGQAGSTAGQGWSRWLAAVRVAAGGPAWTLRMAGSRGAASGAGSPLDRYRLGGVGSSLLPAGVVVARIVAPALPEGVEVGDRMAGWSVALANGPASAFYRGDRVWGGGGAVQGWIRRAGVEWTMTTEPLPLLGLPAMRAGVGVARVLDHPLEGATRWWVSVSWSP